MRFNMNPFWATIAAAGAGGGYPANSLFIDGNPVLVDGFSIVFA